MTNGKLEIGYFPRVGLAAFSSIVRHVLQRGGGFMDRVCQTVGM